MGSNYPNKKLNIQNENNEININTKDKNNENNNNEIKYNQPNEMKQFYSDNKSYNFYNAYKSMIFMNKISNVTFEAFLIKIKTIPNFIKLYEKLEEKNGNYKEIIKNYQLEKKIKLHYLFEKCEKIIKKNSINKNSFIIVDKNFFKYMNIKINDINKKYVIINKNKSIFSIKFLNSNKNLNFNEIK